MYKLLLSFIVLTILGIFYDKYNKKQEQVKNKDEYDLIKKYLLNENAITGSVPIVWVHLDYEVNSRNWVNFGSRNSKALNQPYKYITIQSIINKSKGNFNVCLIDDESFAKLIPGWNIDLNKLSDPVKTHIRTLGIVKLLYYYGGINMPSSYLALEPIENIYNSGLSGSSAFIFETVNRNISSTNVRFYPNHSFMGCSKHSPIMKDLMLYLETLNSIDYTNEYDFNGKVDKWCYVQGQLKTQNKMNILDGKFIGVKDINNKEVLLDHLLEQSYIDYDNNLQGIYIPDKELLRRTKYCWFAKLEPKEIYESEIILGKYMLLSNEMK